MAIYPLEHLVELLAPTRCQLCYQESESLCINCRQTINELVALCCLLCNKVINNGLLCGSCQRKSHISELYCGGLYEAAFKKLIHSYKFDGKRGLADSFAKLLDERLPYFDETTLVTYVPTIAKHIRQRGFDHAERLAVKLARLRGLTVVRSLRRVDNRQQRGQSKSQRQLQARDSFESMRVSLRGKTVLIIDDVMTTGATLSACASHLHKMGATTVVGVVLSHGTIRR